MARSGCGGAPPPSRMTFRPPLTAEPLHPLRAESKGQAGACPDRTRAIPCKMRVALLTNGLRRVDSNGDSNSGGH